MRSLLRDIVRERDLLDEPTRLYVLELLTQFTAEPATAPAAAIDEPLTTRQLEILQLLAESVKDFGQTTVMVTHDAHAAAIADRVLFLGDGLIVKELGKCDAHTILETIEEVSHR